MDRSGALVAALAFASAAAAGPRAQGPESVRGAFFTNWSRYARGYTVKQIPAADLNVLSYAFAFISPSGTCVSSDMWSDFQAPTWSGTSSVDGVADDPSNPNQHPASIPATARTIRRPTASMAPWLYNPSLYGGTFISYVDPQSIAARIALVRALDLRGAWAWEISNDSNANDLVGAMTR